MSCSHFALTSRFGFRRLAGACFAAGLVFTSLGGCQAEKPKLSAAACDAAGVFDIRAKRLEGQHDTGGFTSLLAAMLMLLTNWTPT